MSEIPWHELDENIRSLVEAVVTYNQPDQSCEGHCDHGCSYPWIDFLGSQDFTELQSVLIEYNRRALVKWCMFPISFDSEMQHNVLRLFPKEYLYEELSEYQRDNMHPQGLQGLKELSLQQRGLEELQASAYRLARHLTVTRQAERN